MKELIAKFNSQSKCDVFRQILNEQEWEIYWASAGGTVIRESESEDNIGNEDTYATIQLCDWLGWNDEVKEHKYTFAVFLYVDGQEDGFTMFDTIEEAIEDYKNTCNTVKELLNK